MDIITITFGIALLGAAIGLVGILLRLKQIMNRPFKNDLSRPRGDARRGLLYAFTLGMAPWEKESTRKHWLAYIRGIVFHIGVFVAIAVLPITWLWPSSLPLWLTWTLASITLLGGVLGLAGVWMRLAGPNERDLSVPDDYASVILTGLFALLAGVALLAPTMRPLFYVLAGALFAYVPFSKIRHCVYFFYAKSFFGRGFGQRGVIGQSKGQYSQ